MRYEKYHDTGFYLVENFLDGVIINCARTCHGSYWPILVMMKVDIILFRNCPDVPSFVWLLSKLKFNAKFFIKKQCVHITGEAACCAVFWYKHAGIDVMWWMGSGV